MRPKQFSNLTVAALAVMLMVSGFAAASEETGVTKQAVTPASVGYFDPAVTGTGASAGIMSCVEAGGFSCSGTSALAVGGTQFDMTVLSGNYAGQCSVRGLQGAGDLVEFLCGTDRDNDGFVTDTDAFDDDTSATTPSDPLCGTFPIYVIDDQPNDQYDCEFDDQGWDGLWLGPIGSGWAHADNNDPKAGEDPTVTCYTPDVGGVWDDIIVFTGATYNTAYPASVPFAGIVEITLTLSSAGSCPDSDY